MTRRPDSPRPSVRLSLFRAGVSARLGAALALSGLLWAVIAWAGGAGT